MDLHLWLSLAAICIMGALSPGPSLALVIKNTLTGGSYQGYASAISHGFGVALYALLTVLGMATLITAHPVFFKIIQYAGAAFLAYLGIKALLSKAQLKLDETSENKTHTQSNLKQVNGWRDGFLIAFLNPKLAIFFMALFSQFITANATPFDKTLMVATVAGIDTSWYCLVCFLITRRKVIEHLKQQQYWIDKITGGFLLLLASRVVLS